MSGNIAILNKWLDTLSDNPVEGLKECRDELDHFVFEVGQARCATIALMAEFLREMERAPRVYEQLKAHPFFAGDLRGPRKPSTTVGRLHPEGQRDRGGALRTRPVLR